MAAIGCAGGTSAEFLDPGIPPAFSQLANEFDVPITAADTCAQPFGKLVDKIAEPNAELMIRKKIISEVIQDPVSHCDESSYANDTSKIIFPSKSPFEARKEVQKQLCSR
ncbi:hypothetical protein LTR28_001764 [Elasticomyces elasticus]|nr:hypothetical protein LTR28_001764 [Elasticomyces elasticus]